MLGTEVVDTTTHASSNLLLRSTLNINRNESHYWRIVTWKWNWNFLMGNCLYSFSLVFRICHSEVEKLCSKAGSRFDCHEPLRHVGRPIYGVSPVLCLLVDGLVGTYLGRKFLRCVCVRLIVSVHSSWFSKHLTCQALYSGMEKTLPTGMILPTGSTYHSIMESPQKKKSPPKSGSILSFSETY